MYIYDCLGLLFVPTKMKKESADLEDPIHYTGYIYILYLLLAEREGHSTYFFSSSNSLEIF